jgi:hypothetical protein
LPVYAIHKEARSDTLLLVQLIVLPAIQEELLLIVPNVRMATELTSLMIANSVMMLGAKNVQATRVHVLLARMITLILEGHVCHVQIQIATLAMQLNAPIAKLDSIKLQVLLHAPVVAINVWNVQEPMRAPSVLPNTL